MIGRDRRNDPSHERRGARARLLKIMDAEDAGDVLVFEGVAAIGHA